MGPTLPPRPSLAPGTVTPPDGSSERRGKPPKAPSSEGLQPGTNGESRGVASPLLSCCVGSSRLLLIENSPFHFQVETRHTPVTPPTSLVRDLSFQVISGPSAPSSATVFRPPLAPVAARPSQELNAAPSASRRWRPRGWNSAASGEPPGPPAPVPSQQGGDSPLPRQGGERPRSQSLPKGLLEGKGNEVCCKKETLTLTPQG